MIIIYDLIGNCWVFNFKVKFITNHFVKSSLSLSKDIILINNLILRPRLIKNLCSYNYRLDDK
jgi:hypothetical protein